MVPTRQFVTLDQDYSGWNIYPEGLKIVHANVCNLLSNVHGRYQRAARETNEIPLNCCVYMQHLAANWAILWQPAIRQRSQIAPSVALHAHNSPKIARRRSQEHATGGQLLAIQLLY